MKKYSLYTSAQEYIVKNKNKKSAPHTGRAPTISWIPLDSAHVPCVSSCVSLEQRLFSQPLYKRSLKRTP